METIYDMFDEIYLIAEFCRIQTPRMIYGKHDLVLRSVCTSYNNNKDIFGHN